MASAAGPSAAWAATTAFRLCASCDNYMFEYRLPLTEAEGHHEQHRRCARYPWPHLVCGRSSMVLANSMRSVGDSVLSTSTSCSCKSDTSCTSRGCLSCLKLSVRLHSGCPCVASLLCKPVTWSAICLPTDGRGSVTVQKNKLKGRRNKQFAGAGNAQHRAALPGRAGKKCGRQMHFHAPGGQTPRCKT
eukprot:1156369-Pelagomonas_calceolata.AAC.9